MGTHTILEVKQDAVQRHISKQGKSSATDAIQCPVMSLVMSFYLQPDPSVMSLVMSFCLQPDLVCDVIGDVILSPAVV